MRHDIQNGSDSPQVGDWVSSVLFVIVILYFWVGLSPFASLGDPTSHLQANSANTANQFVMMTVSLSVIMMLFLHPAGHLMTKLWGLLLIIFLWLVITGFLSIQPLFVLRRVAYAVLTCVCACGILLLPRSSTNFAKLMALCLLLILGLCYFGVIALPQRAIHQAGDAIEPGLAGDWRGYFVHKNTAAAVMVYAVFLGLYIRRSYSTGLGILIVVLATIFLWKTGGKTSAAMMPAILIATWAFERAGPFRLLLVGGILGVMNFILMSAAVSPAMQQFLRSNGIDPTFTDRAAIWRIALSAISNSPVTGYGYQSFWSTDAVFTGEASRSNWAVVAESAHNGYVELALHGGLPLLGLMLIWMVILPCRHARIALKRDIQPDLTRLFIRIWLFSVFLGCLESAFLSGDQMWFMTLIGIFGLRLQAYANPVQAQSTRPIRTIAQSRPGKRLVVGA